LLMAILPWLPPIRTACNSLTAKASRRRNNRYERPTGLKGSSRPFDKGRTIMPQPPRRRATTIVLLLFLSGSGGAFYSHSTASEQPAGSARRTAAGLRASAAQKPTPQTQTVERAVVAEDAAEPAVPSVSQAASREQFNRTVFGPKSRPAPARVSPPDAFVPDAAKPAMPDADELPPILPAEPQELPQHRLAQQPTRIPPPAPMPPNPRRTTEAVPPPKVDAEKDVAKLPKFEPPLLTPIGAVQTSIAPPGADMPPDFAAYAQPGPPQELAVPGELPRTSAPFYSTPRVADFTHRPLYFEEKALERNGRTIGLAQPVASFVHFFATVPALPYKMGEKPPSTPMYTGNGVNLPSDHVTVRDRVRGVMTAAGTAIGLSAILP